MFKIAIPVIHVGDSATAEELKHIVGSIYLRRLMAGVYSAPLLLVSSSYLLLSVPSNSKVRI